jgi:hypothetical protein
MGGMLAQPVLSSNLFSHALLSNRQIQESAILMYCRDIKQTFSLSMTWVAYASLSHS